jgi:hypothetical protein
MPYIPQADRRRLALGADHPKTLGELDYIITCIVVKYMKDNYITKFDQLAGIIGMLDLVKDETRRRVVHPYEERKRGVHGDVYPGDPYHYE